MPCFQFSTVAHEGENYVFSFLSVMDVIVSYILYVTVWFIIIIRYHKVANALAMSLQDEFGVAQIQVEMLNDVGRTGNCEVVFRNTGNMLHSTAGGDGRVDNAKATQAIVDKLAEWFDEQPAGVD